MEDFLYGIIVGVAFAFVVARFLFNIMPRMESLSITIRLVIAWIILQFSDVAFIFFFGEPTFLLSLGYSSGFIACLVLIEWKQSGNSWF